MFRSNKKKTISSLNNILYKDIRIPLRIYHERRSSVRISFGQQNVILRLPKGLSPKGIDKHLTWAKSWIEDQLDKNPTLVQRFRTKEYNNGDIININGHEYRIQVERKDRKTVSASLKGNQVLLKLPLNMNAIDLNNKIKRALSRVFASKYQQYIEHRISYLNDLYFKEDIRSIRIKYNKSNWGSCSAKRNINISSRVLFAPADIQDYIFIHELSHLKELNHSKKFWSIVSEIIPDYKTREKWLKDNSHWMDF